MDATTTPPVRLVNATGRQVRVRIGGKTRALPRVEEPVLLQFHPHHKGSRWPVMVEGVDGAAEVEFLPEAQELGVLSCPPRIDGVAYLVDAEVLGQFPDREDFVTPAVWGVERRKKGAGSTSKKTRWVLVAVTRDPWAHTGPKTMMLSVDDKPRLLVDAVRAAGGSAPKKQRRG